jgi:hypothetical protein
VIHQTLPRGHFRNANGVALTGGQESRNDHSTSRYDPPVQRSALRKSGAMEVLTQ